jgi:hypothetical protein
MVRQRLVARWLRKNPILTAQDVTDLFLDVMSESQTSYWVEVSS